jgi:hypothetical protein
MPVTEWCGFLHERDAIQPERDGVRVESGLQLLGRIITDDARPAAPDVRLHEHGKAHPVRGFRHALRRVHDA